MKLEDKDYQDLYPYLSPREIKETYGARAYSERHIQRLYKEWGLVPQDEMRNDIFEASYAIADIEQGETDWLARVAYTIATRAEEAKLLVNRRIKAKELTYS